MIIVNGWRPLNFITKRPILDVAVALDPILHTGAPLDVSHLFFFFDLCQTKADQKTLSHIKLRIYLTFNYYLEYHTNIALKFQRVSKSKKKLSKDIFTGICSR